MKSVFMDKSSPPGLDDLKKALGTNLNGWNEIREYTLLQNTNLVAEWNYASASFGWSYRIKDAKRVIVYLLPRAGFFKIAFVFGQKAIDTIEESGINPFIIQELNLAKKYAEGKGIRIEIRDETLLPDILKLIQIKLMH